MRLKSLPLCAPSRHASATTAESVAPPVALAPSHQDELVASNPAPAQDSTRQHAPCPVVLGTAVSTDASEAVPASEAEPKPKRTWRSICRRNIAQKWANLKKAIEVDPADEHTLHDYYKGRELFRNL